MRKGSPFADPRSGPRYLPGYQRQVVGATGPGLAPDTGGFRHASQWVDNFWKDIEKFTGAATDLAATYYDIRAQRDARDTNTAINEAIRQRKLDVFSTRTGKRADNLLEDEGAWQLKAREEIIKNSGLSANMAAELWDKKAQEYLTRVGAFMLEQNRVAEAESKFAAMVDAQSDLALSPVGDFQAYAKYSAEMDNLYGKGTKDAIQAKEKGIDVLVDSWVEQNPRAALEWFETHKDDLREVLGREFSSASKAMERVRNRLEAEARRREMEAQRAERIRLQQERQRDKAFQSQAITAIVTDDPDFDLSSVIAQGAAAGVDGATLLNIQKTAEAHEKRLSKAGAEEIYSSYLTRAYDSLSDAEVAEITQYTAENKLTPAQYKSIMSVHQRAVKELAAAEKAEAKDKSATVFANYLAKATTTGLTDADRDVLVKMMAEGTLTTAHYNQLLSADNRTSNWDNSGLKQLRAGALRQLKIAVAPSGALDQINQKAEFLYGRLAAEVDKHLDSLDTADQKMRALDLTDPNSYIMRMITLNTEGVTPIDRMAGAFSTDPLDTDPDIIIPDAELGEEQYEPAFPGAGDTNNTVPQRLPGESISEWRKRTGWGN